jgi:hypothetical protein
MYCIYLYENRTKKPAEIVLRRRNGGAGKDGGYLIKFKFN